MSEYSDNLTVADVEAITPAPQPEVATPTAQEAVLREIIDWCHLQPGNYPNWMDRARQAVGYFEGDPGPPPQPSVSVACPAPTPDDETYYSKGKDANWLAALSDEDLAEAVCFAAQDLNDTGLGDDLDKWMPFQAMMCIAADRIKKLITAQPGVSGAQSALETYGREKVRERLDRATPPRAQEGDGK